MVRVMPILEPVPILIPIFCVPVPYPFFLLFHAHTHYKWGGFEAGFSCSGITPIPNTILISPYYKHESVAGELLIWGYYRCNSLILNHVYLFN